MKQYTNFFRNFTVTKIVTENTKYDSKKGKHIKLAKPKVTKEQIFAPKNLGDFADLVRACDIVSDGEGTWYTGDADHTRVLKVEFELEIDMF
tara:strand:+ start:2220 stop:2495 length:276 start_codon:yes stop_codon:yes gene_type:complete